MCVCVCNVKVATQIHTHTHTQTHTRTHTHTHTHTHTKLHELKQQQEVELGLFANLKIQEAQELRDQHREDGGGGVPKQKSEMCQQKSPIFSKKSSVLVQKKVEEPQQHSATHCNTLQHTTPVFVPKKKELLIPHIPLTHDHTQQRTATQELTQPRTAAPHHTQTHTDTQEHTQTHTHAHAHIYVAQQEQLVQELAGAGWKGARFRCVRERAHAMERGCACV